MPLVIVALAVAVVPIPTPIIGGALTLTVALAYPLPTFVISNDDTVPLEEIIAVADAPTLISPEVTSALLCCMINYNHHQIHLDYFHLNDLLFRRRILLHHLRIFHLYYLDQMLM